MRVQISRTSTATIFPAAAGVLVASAAMLIVICRLLVGDEMPRHTRSEPARNDRGKQSTGHDAVGAGTMSITCHTHAHVLYQRETNEHNSRRSHDSHRLGLAMHLVIEHGRQHRCVDLGDGALDRLHLAVAHL